MTFRLSLLLCILTLASPSSAQTRERGPWWPSRWGPNDQAGASNWITPEKILAAVRLVKTGKTYELGQPYNSAMPLGYGRSYTLTIPSRPRMVRSGSNQLVAHDEFLAASIGQVGTQFDGPGHIGKRIRMADGSIQDVFYNGFTREEMRDPYGLKRLGVENVKPIVTRGVLIDVAGLKNVATLPAGYEVTVRRRAGGAPARRGSRRRPSRRATRSSSTTARRWVGLTRAGGCPVRRRVLGSRWRAGLSRSRPRWWAPTRAGPRPPRATARWPSRCTRN